MKFKNIFSTYHWLLFVKTNTNEQERQQKMNEHHKTKDVILGEPNFVDLVVLSILQCGPLEYHLTVLHFPLKKAPPILLHLGHLSSVTDDSSSHFQNKARSLGLLRESFFYLYQSDQTRKESHLHILLCRID